MNAVDRADQMRMVYASQRKEKRLYMNIFTYILDLACVNAFALYKNEIKLIENYDISEFKREICELLVRPWMEINKKHRGVMTTNTNDDVSSIESLSDTDTMMKKPAAKTYTVLKDKYSDDEEEESKSIENESSKLLTQDNENKSEDGALKLVKYARKSCKKNWGASYRW